jgi:quercetin dioxygenase-like cupin family protein
MRIEEARSQETPYGRYITSDGWYVINLADALAVRNEEKGGAMYALEPQEPPFRNFGFNVHVLSPGEPNALYHSQGVQEGFLMLSGACRLIVEMEEERSLRQWDYFHCPANTRHVIVGPGDGPCVILMSGARPDVEIRFPVSEIASKYGASVAKETREAGDAYADWPGEYLPVRLPWSLGSNGEA